VKIPRSHPRYASLVTREKLVAAYRTGVLAPEGLIAHGRGEAFDYLFGEESPAPALVAERAAAAHLLEAKHPVISVNGNVAVLAAKEVGRLARAVPATVEVNLFHRTDARVRKILALLRRAGVVGPLGLRPDARIPGLDSRRGKCSRRGIYGADVVLVPLEDGDRAEALGRMRKKVVAIDLNPLSRTSLAATVSVVDEVTRALPRITAFVEELRREPAERRRVIRSYRRDRNLAAVRAFLSWRLRQIEGGSPPVRTARDSRTKALSPPR